jgi:Ser/Thr protein kinase RdoA (MazF antagonist)
MMKLSQIAGLVGSLDSEGRSPIADTFAARWGYPSARFRRSSASHVFELADADGGVAAFLRFVPDTHRPAGQLAVLAAFLDTLVEHGAPAARPLRSRAGQWVETHRAGVPEGGAALPDAVGRLTDAMTGTGADQPLATAVGVLVDRLRRLPTDAECFGVSHGDFELDNLTWIGDRPTAFDFDEAARSWYVADISYAVRDLAPVPARTPTPAEAPLFGALLTGYRRVRPLPEDDLRHLPLFAALHAATDLLRLQPALDAGTSPTDPPWLTSLRRRLDNHVARLRGFVRRFALA